MCGTCKSRSVPVGCSYDMDLENRWQVGLRNNVKRLETELESLKSILLLIATCPKREMAILIANEISQEGLQGLSVEQIRDMLQDGNKETGLNSGNVSDPTSFSHAIIGFQSAPQSSQTLPLKDWAQSSAVPTGVQRLGFYHCPQHATHHVSTSQGTISNAGRP